METEFVILLQLLWKKRKLLLRNVAISILLAAIIGFSLPKEYTSKVVVAPELSSESSLTSSLGTLASIAGVNVNGLNGTEALFPDLYPEIVSSTPFLMELSEEKITTQDGEIKTTVYDYLQNHQKMVWWDYPLSALSKLLRSCSNSKKDEKNESQEMKSVSLTMEQEGVLNGLKNSLDIELDKMTSLISVEVSAQDPLVASDLSQIVTDKLQLYIVDYRTAKARKDLEYISQLYDDAKKNYYDAQSKYAHYTDSHQNIFLETVKAEQERLESEMSLAFNTYSQLAQQLDLARAKVQERTPVYVVIQPAVVPQMPSGPRKMMIMAIFVFLSFFGTTAWIILKEQLKKYGNARVKLLDD